KTWSASNPSGLVHTPLPPHTKKPLSGFWYLADGLGYVRPILGPHPPRCALRASPSAVQIRSGRICRTRVGSSTHPFRHIPKNPFRGFGMWRKGWDMFGPSLGLTLRAARSGPALRLSRFVPDESVEPKWARPHTPSATYQKTPFGVLVSGGRGGIRTHGWLPIAGFQDRCNRPLCHPSDGGCLAVRAAGANRSQSLAQVAEAAHIGQQHFGYGDRAVGVLVVLHHRDQGATDGHA